MCWTKIVPIGNCDRLNTGKNSAKSMLNFRKSNTITRNTHSLSFILHSIIGSYTRRDASFRFVWRFFFCFNFSLNFSRSHRNWYATSFLIWSYFLLNLKVMSSSLLFHSRHAPQISLFLMVLVLKCRTNCTGPEHLKFEWKWKPLLLDTFLMNKTAFVAFILNLAIFFFCCSSSETAVILIR